MIGGSHQHLRQQPGLRPHRAHREKPRVEAPKPDQEAGNRGRRELDVHGSDLVLLPGAHREPHPGLHPFVLQREVQPGLRMSRTGAAVDDTDGRLRKYRF